MAERKTRRIKWWLQHQKFKKEESSDDRPKGQKKHSDVKGSIKSKTSKQGFTKKAGQFGNQNPEKSHHAMQRGFRTARTSATLESDGTSDAEEPTNSDSRQPESETGRPPSERASDSESTSEDEAQPGAVRSKTSRTKETRESKRRRYILFVGNLPFTVTPEDITGHFQKRGVPVKEVRMLTKKETGEPRGCCFLEFDSSKRLQNALKLHHTAMEGRRINVEVTCGGGGKGEGRQKKIEEKKMKLVKSRRAQKKKQSG